MIERLPTLLARLADAAQASEAAPFAAAATKALVDGLAADVAALFVRGHGAWVLVGAAGAAESIPPTPDVLVAAHDRSWVQLASEDSAWVIGWHSDAAREAARTSVEAARPVLAMALARVSLGGASQLAHGAALDRLRKLVIDVNIDLPTLFQRTVETAALVGRAQDVFLLAFGDPSDPGALAVRAAVRESADLSQVLELGATALRQHENLRAGERERFLAVPFFSGTKPLGCLIVGREPAGTGAAEDYNEADLQQLQAVAEYATMALQSVALLTEQQRRVRELVLLNEVARDCAQLGLDRLLPAVSERLCMSMSLDVALMFFVDQERQELVTGGGFSTFGLLPSGRVRFPIAPMSIATRVLKTRVARRGGYDSVEAPLLREFMREHSLAHIAVVPLQVKDRAIGMLTVGRRTRALTDEELRLLEATCAEIAVALDNSQLFAEARGRADDLALVQRLGEVMARSLDPQSIVQETCSQLMEALGCDALRVYVRNGQMFESICSIGLPPEDMRRAQRLPPTDPVIARTLEATAPVEMQPDALDEPSRSYLSRLGLSRVVAAPLLTADDPEQAGTVSDMGVIIVARKAPRPFSSSERRVLGTVAAQLAVALKNAQLYEQTRQRAEDLAIVADAGRALLGGAPLSAALSPVAERVARLLHVRGCAIMLVDPANREVRNVATFPTVQGSATLTVPVDVENSLSRAMRTRAPQWNRSLVAHPIVAKLGQVPFVPAWSVAVPLIADDEVLGVMVVSDADSRRSLSDAEIERATTIASQVGIAIDRAQLHARLEQSLRDLAQAQAQLVRRERLAALGELAALVAHEVRNPLGVIVNSLGSLAKFADLTGDALRIYEIMQAEAGRLDRIVSDMLDYTRPTEPRLVPTGLGRVLRDALGSVAASERARGTPVDAVRITLTVEPELPPVPMDDRLLHQAFVNLLSNAYQSLGKGGRIAVTAGVSEDGASAEVVVSDDGPGMTSEVKTRLFEPFFTTKAKGSGLGLAMVKRIVDGHGGDISVESALAAGTRFIMRLPIVRAEVPAPLAV
jgi:signal transduction histidine kinase